MQWADWEIYWVELKLSLPRKNRLTRQNDISRVFDTGDFYQGKYCHIIVKKTDHSTCRAAFIVSKKTAAGAVDRNRIRRLMKESFRLKLAAMKNCADIIFLATRRAHKKLGRSDFDQELNTLLSKADLIENNN